MRRALPVILAALAALASPPPAAAQDYENLELVRNVPFDAADAIGASSPCARSGIARPRSASRAGG